MSTSPVYQQAAALVNMMSDDERDRMSAYLDSIRSVKAEHQPVAKTDLFVPLNALVGFIESIGGTSPAAGVLQRLSLFRHNKAKLDQTWKWVRTLAKSRPEQESLFLLGCKCLCSRMITPGLPYFNPKTRRVSVFRYRSVGMTELLPNIDKVPEAVEFMFPGYAQAGLLLAVATRKLGKVTNKSALRS